MNILLINPPAENTLTNDRHINRISPDRGCNPPLGLLYIASTLRAQGHGVEVVDSQVEGLAHKDIARKLRDAHDLVGITAMSCTLIDSLQAATAIKDKDDDVGVVFGGIHPTLYPLETVSLACVDYVVSGEAEYTMPALADAIEHGRPLHEIRGIAYKSDGKAVHTGMSQPIGDLDALPFPARDLTPYRKSRLPQAKRSPATTLFSSRGCPYNCLFCNKPQMGKAFRARSAQNVVDEFQACAGMGIQEILVYDDTFTVDRKRVMDICSGIKDAGIDVGWDIRARVDNVDKDMLAALSAAGCERIYYGVESGSPLVLKALRKGITISQIERAFEDTKAAGIDSLAYFMIGSPKETVQTIEESLGLLRRLDPTFVQFSIATPYPETDMYGMALKEGVIKSDVWLGFAQKPTPDFVVPVWEENLDRREILEQLHRVHRRYYLNPDYMVSRLLKAGSPRELLGKILTGARLLGARP